MDNENGTAAVVTTKADEIKPVESVNLKTDSIDAAIVETVKSAEEVNSDAKLVETAVKSTDLKSLNNTSNDVTVNKTITTVTVNVTQTKTVVDEVDKSNVVGEVVSTVSSIAEAAVSAIDKVEKDKKPESSEVSSLNDIEMVEADEDCEMKDVSQTEQPQVVTTTTTVGSTEPKNTEADSASSTVAVANDSVSASNEAEQKIDDVEKNISNLFNGDDNVVSTNDKSIDDLTKADHSTSAASSQANTDALKNGTEKSGSQTHDAIKDNNDLVSILAGNDKPEENISSSSINASEAPKSATIENKLLKENVSTISEPAIDAELGVGGKTSKLEVILSHSSTANDEKADLSTTVTGSESSSDNLANFTKAVQNINGLSDETDTSVGNSSPSVAKSTPKTENAVDSSIKTTPQTTTPKASAVESVFDVNICYDNTELVYFSVEKHRANKAGSDADKSSSPSGSVSSVTETFALPSHGSTLTSNSSTLSSTSEAPASTNKLDKTRQEIKGTLALCEYIISHFEKLRSTLTPPPATGRRGKSSNVEPTTPSASGTKRKRGAPQESPALNESESEVQPKSAKKAKKEPATPKVAAAASDYPEKAVLARWVDKKFYAGRVVDEKPNSKYVVLFEDGAKKTLPEDHIVFGKENILPLVNESVHALVSEDTYEPGIVQSVETKDDGIYYTVLCESTTVTVTSSDIYLEEDQAKVILSKQASNNPEPGYSGGLNTRKDRRNKRYS